MGVVVGLGVGVGLLLVWSALTMPRTERSASRASRERLLLDRAGLPTLTVRSLVALCLVLAVLAFAAVQLMARAAPVALAFAVIAGYAPVAVVAGRARRRQRELMDL